MSANILKESEAAGHVKVADVSGKDGDVQVSSSAPKLPVDAVPPSIPTQSIEDTSASVGNDRLATRVLSSDLITLDSLVKALNINLHSNRTIGLKDIPDLLPITNVRLELPRVITEADPVAFFTYDSEGYWCVMETKISHANTPFTNYDEWLNRFRHCFEKLTKDAYAVYSIHNKIEWKGYRILPFTSIGIDESVNSGSSDAVSRALENLRPLMVPAKNVNKRYEEIRICLPVAIQDLYLNIHTYILRDDEAQTIWIQRFARVKCLKRDFLVSDRSGDINTQWVASPSPDTLPRMLKVLPNRNLICLFYSLPFVMPTVTFNSFSPSALLNNMGISLIRAEGLTDFVNAQATEENYQDIRRIIMSWVLPSQIVIRITPGPDLATVPRFIHAACAKLLLSFSPGCRNVTRESAELIDTLFSDFVRHCGVSTQSRGVKLASMFGSGVRTSLANAWIKLATTDDGGGWLNDGVNAHREIPDPLYSHVRQLPMYAGIEKYCPMDAQTENDDLGFPPIMQHLLDALDQLSRVHNSKRAYLSGTLYTVFDHLSHKWRTSLSGLNEFIIRTGETGFRVGTDDLPGFDANETSYGATSASRDRPIVLNVSLTSFGILFREMPSIFTSSSYIPKQPSMESGISAELQRLYSIIIILHRRTRVDDRALCYPKSRVLDVVLKGTESNHFAKAIIKMACSDDYSKLLSLDDLSGLRPFFDDFEARYYLDSSKVVMQNPEIFGFTCSFVQELRYAEPISQDKYFERAPEGIITDNSTNIDPDLIHKMTFDSFEMHMRANDLMITLVDSPGKYELPIWAEYSEVLGTSWPEESPPYVLKIPNARLAFTGTESITFGKFLRFFMLAEDPKHYSPDATLAGTPARLFWYSGSYNGHMPFDAALLGNLLGMKVRSWYRFIHFANRLDMLGEEAQEFAA